MFSKVSKKHNIKNYLIRKKTRAVTKFEQALFILFLVWNVLLNQTGLSIAPNVCVDRDTSDQTVPIEFRTQTVFARKKKETDIYVKMGTEACANTHKHCYYCKVMWGRGVSLVMVKMFLVQRNKSFTFLLNLKMYLEGINFVSTICMFNKFLLLL